MLLTRAGGVNCSIVNVLVEAIARGVGLPLSALSEPGAFDAMVRRVLCAPSARKLKCDIGLFAWTHGQISTGRGTRCWWR